MMRWIVLMCLFFFKVTSVFAEEIVMVAHPSSRINALDQKQIVDLYMGRTSTLDDGTPIQAIELSDDTQLKQHFYDVLVDKSVHEINAYWARLLFSGRAIPPLSVSTINKLITRISENKQAVGYIWKKDLTNQVKVIGHVE
jgi:hypothetical protein